MTFDEAISALDKWELERQFSVNLIHVCYEGRSNCFPGKRVCMVFRDDDSETPRLLEWHFADSEDAEP